jgi:hypothetical protein
LPCGRNANGDGTNPARTFCPFDAVGFFPSWVLSAGFGSNVSTWLGPPFMNRKMTRFAFAGKCAPAAARGASNPARPSAPNPMPAVCRRSRREGPISDCGFRIAD